MIDEGIDTLKKTERFRTQWFEKYARVEEYIGEVHQRIRRQGYIENIFGRRRRTPEIKTGNKEEKAAALREGLNGLIQGSASDLTQISVTRLPEIMHHSPASRFLFSVHDAIIMEMPCDEIDFGFEVKALMEESPAAFDFPLIADLERFPERWGNNPIEWKNDEWVGGHIYK